ncbi:MAG TPA: tRNA (N(6)-L-threonylcarbamoyladenosine(37)-C(2))-methylthiotransferase MtaB [Clostridiales bacterium]|nr:tRNA (N(6)-L-threonylcarbamoyladenosine(37)-C(2))-methylthiotransferase MtaB [Clostridiaceae bacterium]HOQ08267.1 tRNA (N(6)-L-threonylcarbamoyladenosine(37)-C(2))-methylthiotransferase MtaB [Clostridiales bacterium]
MKKAAFYTLGCKVNQYETEAMAEAFEKAGYAVVDFEEAADVYVINTCTVTGLSSRKSRQAIRRAKQRNRNAVVVAVGCYPQTAKEEVESMSEVDIIVGTAERRRLPEYVEEFLNGGGRITAVGNIMKEYSFEDLSIEKYKSRTRAIMKVQDGCSQFCSYCIIPYARGPIRSRPAEEVLGEVRRLVEAGFREVVLTGIHIASYGLDLGQIRLPDLIRMVHDVDGIERIRLGSLEPTMITEGFVAEAARLEKLCPHYHISLQSGCDETLKRMNRKYTTAEYAKAVDLLRDKIPDVSVTTDVMVGFPGETDEEFETTYRFLEKIRFAKMHVFKYSPRKGTPAARRSDQVDGRVKEERSERLIELSDRCQLEFNSSFLGRVMPVLYEQEDRDRKGWYEGLTPNYIRVLSKGDAGVVGNILPTRLVEAENDFISGEV